jgi:hypothetical protein
MRFLRGDALGTFGTVTFGDWPFKVEERGKRVFLAICCVSKM